MNGKIFSLIFRLYIAISVAICGFFYINPNKIYANDKDWIRSFGKDRLLETDYSNFQYSVLISIVGGILLVTFMNYMRKPTNK